MDKPKMKITQRITSTIFGLILTFLTVGNAFRRFPQKRQISQK